MAIIQTIDCQCGMVHESRQQTLEDIIHAVQRTTTVKWMRNEILHMIIERRYLKKDKEEYNEIHSQNAKRLRNNG